MTDINPGMTLLHIRTHIFFFQFKKTNSSVYVDEGKQDVELVVGKNRRCKNRRCKKDGAKIDGSKKDGAIIDGAKKTVQKQTVQKQTVQKGR